ncbi:hypothetical protein CHS0354_035624, partial [Potamilus streckersoni]
DGVLNKKSLYKYNSVCATIHEKFNRLVQFIQKDCSTKLHLIDHDDVVVFGNT